MPASILNDNDAVLRSQDLKARALEWLDIWCKPKDRSNGTTYLDESATMFHDAKSPVTRADTIKEGWAKGIQFLPEYKLEIRMPFWRVTNCGYLRRY